jgi:hypothetical protein
MSILQSYPLGNPTAKDYVIGTKIPPADTDAKPTTNNFSVSSIIALASASENHKVYVAELNNLGAGAVGTSAPVATVLQNTTGGTFTWSYTNAGRYQIAVSGITLPANKVALFMSPSTGDQGLGGVITTTTQINVEQFSSGGGGYTDGMAAGTSIEIRIYS